MLAAYYRHDIKQGEDYFVDVDLVDSGTPIDTTGWTGASSIVTIDHVAPVDEDNNPIVFTVTFPVSGTVRFALPADKSKQLRPVRHLYDAKLTDASGSPTYYLDGDVLMRRSYTP